MKGHSINKLLCYRRDYLSLLLTTPKGTSVAKMGFVFDMKIQSQNDSHHRFHP